MEQGLLLIRPQIWGRAHAPPPLFPPAMISVNVSMTFKHPCTYNSLSSLITSNAFFTSLDTEFFFWVLSKFLFCRYIILHMYVHKTERNQNSCFMILFQLAASLQNKRVNFGPTILPRFLEMLGFHISFLIPLTLFNQNKRSLDG